MQRHQSQMWVCTVCERSPCGEKKAESQYRAGNPSGLLLPESVERLNFWPSCFQVVISNMYLVRSQGRGRAAEGMAAAPSQVAFATSLHSLPRSSTHHSPGLPQPLFYTFMDTGHSLSLLRGKEGGVACGSHRFGNTWLGGI